MSNNGATEVTVVITIVIVPAVSIVFPTIALIAIAGVLAAALIGGALAVLAIVCWMRCMYRAVRERDWGWLRDLVLVPTVAAWLTVLFAAEFASWADALPGSDMITHLKTIIPQHGPIVIVPIILGPLAAFLWFWAVAATPRLLARRDAKRLLAYPSFSVFSIWITAIVLTWQP